MILIFILTGLIWWYQREEVPPAINLETAISQIEASSEGTDQAVIAEPETPNSDPAIIDTGQTGDGGINTTTVDREKPNNNSVNVPGDTVPDTKQGTINPNTTKKEGLPAPSTSIAGVWTLKADPGITDLIDNPPVSFAGFRVNEVLAKGIGSFTAVGRTAAVSGTIELTETALVAAEITVDFTTLRTDDSHRDSHVQKALNTAEFPDASFTLTEPVQLPDKSFLAGPAIGDLTIKGKTNSAVFDLEAQLVDDTLVVVGESPIVFADYEVTAPSSLVVISVEDHGIIEFQLYFTRQPSDTSSASHTRSAPTQSYTLPTR